MSNLFYGILYCLIVTSIILCHIATVRCLNILTIKHLSCTVSRKFLSGATTKIVDLLNIYETDVSY